MITVASASVDQAQAQAAVTSSISKKKINNNKEGEEEEDGISSSALEEEEEVFLFKSRLPDIEICDDMPLHAYCFERLAELGDRPCLISALTGKTLTFSETHEACLKTAAGLRSLGISSGDAIMILLPNCEHFVFTFMAASFIGALATTANPFYTASEISKQLQASKAKLIVTQSHYLPKLKHIITGSSSKIVVIVIDDDHKDRDDDDDEWCLTSVIPFSELLTMEEEVKENTPPPPFSPSAPVALPFSSGTTGLPKGVVLTHKSLITSVAQQVDGDNPNLELRREDVVLCVLPLFHIFSLNSVLLCSLRAGASVLLLPKFEINSLLSLIQLHRVTVAAVVPPLVMALAKNPDVARYDLSSIRLILSGAAPLAKDLIQALQARLPNAILGQGYGMTEAGPVLTMCMSFAKLPSPTKSGSCGTVVRNAELKVVDPETGRSLGYNQPGEICIRGDQIMKGYLNDDAATAATGDSDGFLHTGDIGYVDDDDEVFIVDRVKELIKFKGFQVPPAELEALLVSHPLIADAAAVPQKDEVAGEVPVAFVVRSNGAELTEEDVKGFIAKQVVFYKRLHKVYFVESIPKSPSGKILRKDLRAKLIASASV